MFLLINRSFLSRLREIPSLKMFERAYCDNKDHSQKNYVSGKGHSLILFLVINKTTETKKYDIGESFGLRLILATDLVSSAIL